MVLLVSVEVCELEDRLEVLGGGWRERCGEVVEEMERVGVGGER